ncbi:MAG: M4 family metallopeptidase, partial [Chitinophagales bacterium]
RYTGKVYDYYQTVHSRNGFNGAGGLFRIVSHLGSNYNNGYWDGSQVNLGDGTGSAATGDDYECSDDWLAHEWTHAYTQYTCGLQYLNEAGALNEAFSDIMAAFITGDWLVFEDTWLKASAPAWRNMIDPTNGGMWNVADPINSVLAGHQPSHYSTRYIGGSDNGGVHINSGIINNLYYLLTVGGTHTVSSVSVTGIGQSASEQLLWKCMSDNLVGHSTATFLDFRQAMLDACLELFPTDLVKLSQVKNAFHAVGIGPDLFVRDNLADSGTEPFGGSYLWASPDIINRKIAVSNPVVAFADLTNDSLWENVEYGQNNFVYVRVQNRGDVTGDTTVNVYMSGATTFGTPASWIHVGSTLVTSVAPGTMKVSNAITFASALIPAPGHYCMIAVLSSPLDPAPDHSLITSVSQYLDFVRNTNNIAYRNMDVEDIMPGVPGSYGAVIQNMKDQPEYYDLKIDLRRFVPGVKMLLKGDRKFLDGAIPQGLKLIAREKNINVYQLLQGNNYFKNRLFIGACENIHALEHGFRNVLVDKPFKLEVIYQVDEDFQIQRNQDRIYELQIQQFWKGENVGAAGIRLQAIVGKKMKPRN